MYDGLLELAQAIDRTGEECSVIMLELEVADDDYDPWVKFKMGSTYGELSGDIRLRYEEAQSLEEEEFYDAGECGGTVDQLIYDVLVKNGKVEDQGLRTGYVLGENFFVVPPKNPDNVQDDERVVFTDVDEALAHMRKLKRRKPKRKAA